MMNYDPNLFCSGNRAKQQINLTFAMWDYRKEVSVTIYSNMQGFEAIRWAVTKVYEGLSIVGVDDTPRIVLTNEVGDELLCDDEDGWADDWLLEMLVRAEIVSVEPGGRIFDPIPEAQSHMEGGAA